MPSAVLQNKDILIVDDAQDIRTLLRRILENDGGTVLESASVDDAVARAKEKAPALIITDLNMPGKTGFDLLRARKADPALREVPVLVLSALGDRKSVIEAVSLGASDFLLKPIRAAVVIQKVRKHLKSRSFARRNFAEGARPAVTLSLAADVRQASETGLTIDSPIKLAPETRVDLSGEFLEKLGCQQVLMRTVLSPAPAFMNGRYVGDINFVGIGESLARSIREALKEHK